MRTCEAALLKFSIHGCVTSVCTPPQHNSLPTLSIRQIWRFINPRAKPVAKTADRRKDFGRQALVRWLGWHLLYRLQPHRTFRPKARKRGFSWRAKTSSFHNQVASISSNGEYLSVLKVLVCEGRRCQHANLAHRRHRWSDAEKLAMNPSTSTSSAVLVVLAVFLALVVLEVLVLVILVELVALEVLVVLVVLVRSSKCPGADRVDRA